jgi:hypothetical protein
VHGYGKLHRAEAGSEMPTAARDVFDHVLPNLRRENGKLAFRQFFYVLTAS